MFEKIRYILTIENTLNLKTYTLDFEIALQKAFFELFPFAKCIGCYYHYCRNIREKAKELKLLKEKDINCFLNEFYKLPFNYYKNKDFMSNLNKTYNSREKYLEYLQYFEKQWKPYFEKGILNYVNVPKKNKMK